MPRMLERAKARKPPNEQVFSAKHMLHHEHLLQMDSSMIKLTGHKFKLYRNKGAPVDFVHAERFLD